MVKRKKKCDIRIIDNFLEEETFKKVQQMFEHPDTSWFYTPGVSTPDETLNFTSSNPLDNFMFAHVIYDRNEPRSNSYEEIGSMVIPAVQAHAGQEFNVMTRMKANMYVRTHEVNIHPWHVDSAEQPLLRGALLMLNTCDGYTGFIDGTTVDSVANRMVFFDAHEKHHSTSTSNASRRLTLNINYV